jgi:glycosyltransferase involved in cell wall biosynthesis
VTSVLIDASQLTGVSAHSGIGSYVRHLLAGLVAATPVDVRALAAPGAQLPGGVVAIPIHRLVHHGRLAVYEHEIRRSLETARHPAGVFHNPNPHAPIRPPQPWVQTLHDIIPLVFDDPVMATERKRWQRFGPRYAKADAVIAISRHAADQGIRLLGIRPDRITVIHHGIGPEFVPGPIEQSDPPYLTLVSEYSKRKGHATAYQVIAALADAGLPHRLKVAGRVPYWEKDAFAAELAGAPRPDRVDALGFVDDLPDLYRGAAAHLVPSRYEGFGFPAVEAMACGTPVVAFANTSTTEVVDSGGVLVADGDVAAMIAAVEPILRDPDRRQQLSEDALIRARAFSWARSAQAHAEVYASVARA